MTVPGEVKLNRHRLDLDDDGHDIYAGTGTFVAKIEGGQDIVKAHGSMGATETFDPTDGNVHTGTLNANCTVTLDPPTGSGGTTLIAWLTQAGGPWTLAFAASGGGSFTWDGTTPTIPATGTFRVVLERIPGTSNDWVGDMVGAGGSALTVKDEGTPLDTAVTSIDAVGAGITATNTGHAVTLTVPGQTFATPSIAYGTPAGGAASTGVRSDATIAKPTAADVDFSSDVTTSNATTGHHGLLPKLDGNASHALLGDGTFGATPAGSVQHILLADGHSTPFAFTDLLQMDDGSDFMWSDPA